MVFTGISREFDLTNEQQYNTIGAFWDELAAVYGLENLQGLGYNWLGSRMSYAIGLKQGDIAGYNVKISLPDTDWKIATGKTACLKELYDEIYKDGPLWYEIETFTEDGSCAIRYIRGLSVNGAQYKIIKLLGHGKGGYSYLAQRDGKTCVLKQIHHEPCDYYTFGNKIEAERRDYDRLLQTGIRIPKMLDIDIENERIIKQYVEGPTIQELVKANALKEEYLAQVREMADKACAMGLNIDYYPTNFVVQDGLLYYIDYECNSYEEQWSFENWGIGYWRNENGH